MRWPRLEDFACCGDLFWLGLGNALLILGASVTLTALMGTVALLLLHEWCFDLSCLEDDEPKTTVQEPRYGAGPFCGD